MKYLYSRGLDTDNRLLLVGRWRKIRSVDYVIFHVDDKTDPFNDPESNEVARRSTKRTEIVETKSRSRNGCL